MSLYTQSFPPPAYVVRPEVVIELAYHQVRVAISSARVSTNALNVQQI